MTQKDEQKSYIQAIFLFDQEKLRHYKSNDKFKGAGALNQTPHAPSIPLPPHPSGLPPPHPSAGAGLMALQAAAQNGIAHPNSHQTHI